MPGVDRFEQHDRKAAEKLEIGLEALHDGQACRAFDVEQRLAPLEGVDGVLGLQRAERLLLDSGGVLHGEVALAFEHQPDQGAAWPGEQAAAASEQRDLVVQRVAPAQS